MADRFPEDVTISTPVDQLRGRSYKPFPWPDPYPDETSPPMVERRKPTFQHWSRIVSDRFKKD